MDPNEDKADALSKSKRTFVLGVVDTSGMKSAPASRKRRWDQPPEEEVDGAAPAKVAVKELVAPAVEPAKTKESIEDELHEIFFDTSETVIEETPAEGVETICDPVAALTDEPAGVSLPMETSVEISSSVPIEPEKVNSSERQNDKSTPEVVEKVEAPSKTAPSPPENIEVAKLPSQTVPSLEVAKQPKVPSATTPDEAKKPSTVKVTPPKTQDKKDVKTVSPVIISDSLKAIQFCYDEDDSNSSQSSNEEGAAVVIPAVSEPKKDQEELSNEEGAAVVLPAVSEPKKDEKESVVQPSGEVEVTVDPDVNTLASEDVDAGLTVIEEVLIEPTSHKEAEEKAIEQSLLSVRPVTKDRSRSPTPVLTDDQDEDSTELATELIQPLVDSGAAEEISAVQETPTGVDISSSIVDEENSAQVSADIYDAVQSDECLIESELVSEIFETSHQDDAKLEDDVSSELLNDKVQQIVEESGSMEATENALEKGGESFIDKSSPMDSLDAPSEQSDNSKTIVEPSSRKPEQDQTNLISMDNSQNCCVSFDDMSNARQASKSPDLELRYSDSEESNDFKQSNPEVTMHFASVRTQDSAHDGGLEPEELKDESSLAIDALINANPELEDKPLNFEEQTQSQTTMEMLDSLVRRSSEDDPTGLSQGGGLFSEDSLINEINQLPDQDDNDKVPDSGKAAKKCDARTNVGSKNGAGKPSDIVVQAKVSDPVSSIAESVPDGEEIEKSETCPSVDEEFSQGADEESKNVTVSSANILEVIFGSEPKSSDFPSISSLEGDSDVQKKTEEGSSKLGTDGTEKPASDSKLQLNNEDFEMGSAEIVSVDPTQSLSGEESDDEVSSSKPEELKEKVDSLQDQEPAVVETKQSEDGEGVQVEEICQSVSSQAASDDVTIEEVPIVKDSKEVVSESESSASEPPKTEDVVGLEMDVDESSTNNKEITEPSDTGKLPEEPMEVDDSSTPAVGKSSRSAEVPKHSEAPSKTVKEPVPVLIIKKQSLPSKKLGESETLLTCSPKSADTVATSSPSRKPSNESLHVDTVQEAAEVTSPKHSPITLRIYKDNLTVKTDLDSPKRNKSPLSSEFKSELSPRPGVSDSSPQNKQLEFTLKIAKDVNTNQPKATMSPKHVASPTSVWKSEVHVDAPEKHPRSAVTTEKQPRNASAPPMDKAEIAAGKQSRTGAVPGEKPLSTEKHPRSGVTTEKQPRKASAPLTDKAEIAPRKQIRIGALSAEKSLSTEKQPRSVVTTDKQPQNASAPPTDKADMAAGKKIHIGSISAEDPLPPESATKVETQPSVVPAAAAEAESALSTGYPAETVPFSGEIQEEETVVKPTPTRGRRGRGGNRRTPGGRRRGGAAGLRGKVEEPIMVPDEDASEVKIKTEVEELPKTPASSSSLGLQMTDAFKKMMSQEKAALPQPEAPQPPPTTPAVAEVETPVTKKRGRPRKSVQRVLPVPEEIVPIKTEPVEPVTPADVSGSEAGEDTPSGRPKRTCRGRTKPIVVRRKRGGAAGGVPRGASTPLPVDPAEVKQEGTPPLVTASPDAATGTASSTPDKPAATPTPSATLAPVLCHKCGTEMREVIRGLDHDGNPRRVHRCPRGGCQVYRFPHLTYEISKAARGRGNFKRPTPDRNTLSEKELAELQKIEARKEKLRQDRIAKYEAKKAKKLAKKLKDEERRKRQAQEKAEKAAAAAPQVFEEETRMSAPDSGSRGHTPAPNRIVLTGDAMGDESQNSITTPGDSNRGNKKGRMELSMGDPDYLVQEVKVDDLAEYQWQGSELYMIQEQVSLYLGVKSFKRRYPGLKRRTIEAEERTFLEDSGLVPKSMCDLGITAVSSAEILDIMFQDFPDKYEEFRKYVRDKQAREASYKQKAAIGLQKKDGAKPSVEPREQALEAVASWNANLNRERREERKCALDLQTFTVHYPKIHRDHMAKPTPKVGLYPVAVIPGQFCDFYKKYTPNELMYFPINTVLYGPLKPNERQTGSDDGSASESSSSSSSSSSSGESSSESESEGEDPPKCTMCNGTKKKNKESLPEVLLSCIQCKTCYHPSCKEFTPEMTPHLVKYEWQCTACKKCTKCRDPNLKDRIMCCQLCDRGYHLSCIGLKKMPEGRWHCSVCAYCSSCDSRNPGGSDWQHEFKKGEKGSKVYQRTLCTPCFKLWRKGKYCQLCSKCHGMKPEEDPNLIQCNSCDRWLHKECYGTKYGIQNKLLSTSSIQCDICVERIQNSSISGLNRSLIKV